MLEHIVSLAIYVIFAGLSWKSLMILYQISQKIEQWYKWQTVGKPRRRLGERMVETAAYLQPIVVYNESGKGVAVCRYDLFTKAVSEWMLKVSKETDPKKIIDWQFQKTVVFVTPTFTFSSHEGVAILAHTGNKKDAEQIMEWIVEKVTGIKREQVEKKYFDRAVAKLAIRDRRLFVPFESGLSGELSLEKQFQLFGKTTLLQAEENLTPY